MESLNYPCTHFKPFFSLDYKVYSIRGANTFRKLLPLQATRGPSRVLRDEMGKTTYVQN